MARAHSTVAVGCVVLGLADVVYLDLAVAPALVGERSRPAAAGAGTEAGPLLTTERGPAPPGEPGARVLDPELVARTGAEPVPDGEPPRPMSDPLLARAEGSPGADLAPQRADLHGEQAAEPDGKDAGPDGGDGDGDGDGAGADTLPSEPVHVRFARDRSMLTVQARIQLDRVAGWLSSSPALHATIDGHADQVGENDHNDQLSRRRAQVVAAYMASRGVARPRMTVRAFGENQPLDRGLGALAYRRNRRVEIRVAPASGAP